MYEESIKNYNYDKLLGGLIETSNLSRQFFSKINIDFIQKKIRELIYEGSYKLYKVDVNQDETDLLIAMRDVYLEYARYVPQNTSYQINILNKILLDMIMPDIMTNIKQEHEYLNVIDKPLDPIPLPINVHNAKQQLPSIFTSFQKK